MEKRIRLLRMHSRTYKDTAAFWEGRCERGAGVDRVWFVADWSCQIAVSLSPALQITIFPFSSGLLSFSIPFSLRYSP